MDLCNLNVLNTLKLNPNVYEKYKYGHLGRWHIKSTLFKRFQNWNKFSKKIKQLLAKLQSSGQAHFVVAILFVLTLASDRAVLNGNDVLSILVASTKKRYSSFLKEDFVFQKICFQVKVLKTFETFSDCHIKTSLSNGGLFRNPQHRFLEEPMLFLLALK